MPVPRLRQIPRHTKFPASWRDLVARGKPFVVTGAARCRLTLARVAELGESTDVVVKNQVDGAVGKATLADLVGCLDQEGATWYMAQHAVPACLEPHVPRRPVHGAGGLRKPNVWLGSTNAFTRLHQDVLHNVVLQLDGVKQFTLFAPGDARFLYRETERERANYSQIPRIDDLDLARFPDFARATPYRVILRPGDVLVMPAYWWHEVLTLEASLMLNYWWAPKLPSVRACDAESQIFTAEVATRHVMKHLDLRGLASDHALVDALAVDHPRLAAIVLGELADEFVTTLAARHGLDGSLYPLTLEALLDTRGLLDPGVADLLKQIRREASAAAGALEAQREIELETRGLNAKLRRRCASPCKRLVRNNAAWMTGVSANSYLF